VDTVWVFGDQLNRAIGALAEVDPGEVRVLLVELTDALATRRYHRQRLHLVLSAVRRFAAELEEEGFDVDLRRAPTLLQGLAEHRREHRPGSVRATEPLSWGLERQLQRVRRRPRRSNQFSATASEFAAWARPPRLVMEDFYRAAAAAATTSWTAIGRSGAVDLRRGERSRRPRDGRGLAGPGVEPLDDARADVLATCRRRLRADPVGSVADHRAAALTRLDHVVADVPPRFGPHEDAMLTSGAPGNGANAWRLNHSMLSSSLNIGLLLPGRSATPWRPPTAVATSRWRRPRGCSGR
jgi:deoxyribodipyrimidine photolyase-related protein